MARPSYGPEAKKRSKLLLVALLDYANDLLDCDDVALDQLRSHIQAYWQTEQRLVIRTKIRYLEALSKLAASSLTGEQIKEALRRFEDFLEILEDNRPNRGGSETWHFTLNLWYKRSDRPANLRRFDEEWEQRRPQKSKQVTELELPPVDTPTDIWWKWCQDLEAQQYQRLTTNPLTVTDGVTFALHELYMPLELVERQQHDKRDVDVKPDAGSSLYEPESDETAQVLALETFLESLRQPESLQRIAIVGEPGAGKTTLLQKIATWLLENHALPIWISLADLQGATLEQYLLQDWLKQATRKVSVTPELQALLAQQFHQGRVWLLLDAVDEMATDGSTALAAIARQLRGWVADAHVILTCRLNVWDGSKNALFTFTTYRNLSFGYGNSTTSDRVREFIYRWFGDNLASSDLAARLRRELDKPERRRLKDAVKNPLRLALLCRSWALTQGTLPTTKATLYQQFVETIYEWKQDRFPTTLATRQQLNQALGELALQALAQPQIRFRLPQSFVQQTFKQAVLMPLALQLGWLNQVGISTASGEKVYAFYHPTFQEYFAAMAIADWQFFFNSVDPPIFATQWREVILLWLGRTDISIADKEAFVQALTEFEDGCGDFYHYQAYFLAAAGLAEFPQCSQTPAILAQLIDWRFGAATWQEPRLAYPLPLSEGARVALLQTDRSSAIASLEQFVQSTSNLFAGWNAACTLGKTLDPANPYAITALEQLIQTVHSENLRLQIADSLGKVDPGNAIAIHTVIEILESTQPEVICRKAAYCLGKIDPGNPQAIAALEHLITSTTDSTLRLQAAENLKILAPTHSLASVQQKPQRIARTSRKHQTAKVKNLDKAISTLERGLLMTTDAANQRRIAYRLATLQPGHSQAIAILLELLLASQPSALYKRLTLNLKEVLLDEQLAEIVPMLRLSLADKSDRSIQAHECYKLLWHCAQRMTYSSFYQAWRLDN